MIDDQITNEYKITKLANKPTVKPRTARKKMSRKGNDEKGT
jgi:hypothetical protein